MVHIISFSKVLDHESLSERLRDLRQVVTAAREEAPDRAAGPVLAVTAAALLREIYQLVSREPGARALPRIDRRRPPDHRALAAMLRDAKLALDTFAWRHHDHDDEYGDEWLTVEGIEAFYEKSRNLSPSRSAAR